MHVPAIQPSTGHCVPWRRLIQCDILFHANLSVDVMCREGEGGEGEGGGRRRGGGREEKGRGEGGEGEGGNGE